MARPLIHVVITRYKTSPTAKGNQPPDGIFRQLEDKNTKSMDKKKAKNNMLAEDKMH